MKTISFRAISFALVMRIRGLLSERRRKDVCEKRPNFLNDLFPSRYLGDSYIKKICILILPINGSCKSTHLHIN